MGWKNNSPMTFYSLTTSMASLATSLSGSSNSPFASSLIAIAFLCVKTIIFMCFPCRCPLYENFRKSSSVTLVKPLLDVDQMWMIHPVVYGHNSWISREEMSDMATLNLQKFCQRSQRCPFLKTNCFLWITPL